jgi:hypothetical protein
MKFALKRMTAAAFLVVALAPGAGVEARQKSRAKSKSATSKEKAAQSKEAAKKEPQSELARLREELVRSTKEYKASLEELRKLYEKEVERADERVSKTKELYGEGLVSKRELEREEEAAAAARAKAKGVEGQLKNADVQIAETLVEAEAEEVAAKALAQTQTAQRARGGLITTTAYIRYGGARAWSLGEAGAVMQFFTRSFGHQLPVSSFGQSPVHDRWGYDHHNAMDVGLSPDSAEGRALMEYLRSAGIPFTAFRFAIPGTATGPHIHVGRPSHKIAPR